MAREQRIQRDYNIGHNTQYAEKLERLCDEIEELINSDPNNIKLAELKKEFYQLQDNEWSVSQGKVVDGAKFMKMFNPLFHIKYMFSGLNYEEALMIEIEKNPKHKKAWDGWKHPEKRLTAIKRQMQEIISGKPLSNEQIEKINAEISDNDRLKPVMDKWNQQQEEKNEWHFNQEVLDDFDNAREEVSEGFAFGLINHIVGLEMKEKQRETDKEQEYKVTPEEVEEARKYEEENWNKFNKESQNKKLSAPKGHSEEYSVKVGLAICNLAKERLKEPNHQQTPQKEKEEMGI